MKASSGPVKLELLSPARDLVTAKAAIDCGADAVYIGPEAFGARSKAANSTDDIKRLVDYALPFGVKIYATVNTILHDRELERAQHVITALWRAGVDALIIQDMSLLRLDIPPIALHASTQCDIRDVDKARLLAALGFERLVLARELNPAQIREISLAVPGTGIEAFVHGALCVSYSGDCHAGYALTGRSANRGECPQICRLKFSLCDKNGKRLAPDAHFLSLKDMNRLDMLPALAEAGVTSFKIEGRLKDLNYVRTVVSVYRRALDRLIEKNPGHYARLSAGSSSNVPFSTPRHLLKVFNRGFTPYIFEGKGLKAVGDIGAPTSPKWLGQETGIIKSIRNNRLTLALNADITLNNGDGLTALSPDGTAVTGFRVNRAEGPVVTPSEMPPISPGWKVSRNRDMAFDAAWDKSGVTRRVALDMTFRVLPDRSRIALTLDDHNGHRITVTDGATLSRARSPQTEPRRKTLSKWGDTPFEIKSYSDLSPDSFVPASELGSLKRKAHQALMADMAAKKEISLRLPADLALASGLLAGKTIDYHWNVANHEAAALYTSLGAKVTGQALECTTGSLRNPEPRVVMTTRFCLRRQMGACLKSPDAARLPDNLRLKAPGIDLSLEFDCKNCVMKILSPIKPKDSVPRA